MFFLREGACKPRGKRKKVAGMPGSCSFSALLRPAGAMGTGTTPPKMHREGAGAVLPREAC